MNGETSVAAPRAADTVRSKRKRIGGRIETSIADAVFTQTQQRVYALLFGQPNRRFFVTELIDLAGMGRGSVQRELAKLATVGLATPSRVGNRVYYQANRDSPIFEDLCAIVRKTIGIECVVKNALKPLTGKLSLAAIYGSVANRTDTAESDIDLLLVSDDLTLESVYSALHPAEKLLGRQFHPLLYKSREYRQRRSNRDGFLAHVLEGPKIVIVGSTDDV